MSRQRRKFSVEQKFQILSAADQQGITQTLRRHNLSHSVFLRWKQQFNTGGAGSLKPQYNKVDPQVKELTEENARLKKIIGHLPGQIDIILNQSDLAL